MLSSSETVDELAVAREWGLQTGRGPNGSKMFKKVDIWNL